MMPANKFGAVFVITLIILLPVQFATAYAQIDSLRITGESNVDGFRKQNDVTRVEANVTGSNIQPSQLTINGVAFTSIPSATYGCQNKGGNIFSCFMQTAKSIIQPFSYSYQIAFGGTSQPVTIVADGYAPSVWMSATQLDKNVTVNYEVNDTAYPGVSNVCAGIKKLEILDGTSVIATIDGSQPNICSPALSGAKSVDIATTGNHNICLKAYDNLWKSNADSDYVSPKCQQLFVDRSAPVISSIQIVDPNNQPVNYLSSLITQVKIKFNVTESGMPTNVVVNASDLSENAGLKSNYENLPAACSNVSNSRWSCETAVVQPVISQSTNVNVLVHVEDTFGNSDDKTLSLLLNIDINPPNAVGLASDASYNSTSFFGNNYTTVYATFDESDSGLTRGNIFLDLSSVMGSKCCIGGNATCGSICNQVRAARCYSTSGTTWRCDWPGVSARSDLTSAQTGQSFSASIVSPSQDDAANLASGLTSAAFVYDGDDPKIENITVLPGNAQRRLILSGDSVIIQADIIEPTSAIDAGNSFADLSNLFTSGHKADPALACTDRGNHVWTCSWGASGIRDGYYKKPISVTVKDIVGNAGTKSKNVEVFATRNDTQNCFNLKVNPDYVYGIEQATILNYPGSYYYETVPFTMEQQCSIGNAEPVDAQIVSCSSPGVAVRSNPITILANPNGGYSGVFQLAISPSGVQSNWDKIQLSCDVSYYTRSGTRIFTTPETKRMNLTLRIFNDLADPGAKISQQITNIKHEVTSGWDKFNTKIDNALAIGRSICGLKSILGTAITIIGVVWSIFATCENLPIPPAAAACRAAKTGARGASDALSSSYLSIPYLDAACGVVTCDSAGISPVPGKGSFKIIGGWCDDLRKMLQYRSDFGAVLTGLGEPSNLELAKKSYLFSAACFCLPGFSYNFNKYRQLECWKGVCYRDFVQLGIPKSECDTQANYQNCVYNAGQFSAILDIVGVPLANMVNAVVGIGSNPIAHQWGAAKWAAQTVCDSPNSGGSKLATYIGYATPAISAISTIAALINNKDEKDNLKIIISFIVTSAAGLTAEVAGGSADTIVDKPIPCGISSFMQTAEGIAEIVQWTRAASATGFGKTLSAGAQKNWCDEFLK